MATLDTSTNYYKLDNSSVLGLHLEAGASDGLIANAQEILATVDGEASNVQGALDNLTATATANKVASSGKTVTITESTSGTNLEVNIDNDTLVSSDGVISVSDEALVQYVGENAIAISETDSNNKKTVSLTISSSDEVLSQSSAGLIANLSISDAITTSSTIQSAFPSTYANIKEIYQLIGKDSNVLGSIPVYKDSALASVSLGTTGDTVDSSTGAVTSGSGDDALVFVYHLENGTYSLSAINLADFLRESEFGDGLTVSSTGVVSVQIDSASESYLSVSSSGVKLSGVDSAISSAISALDVSSVGSTGSYIKTISETDGKISATTDAFVTSLTSSTTSTVAPTSAAVVSYVDSAIDGLDLSQVGGSGYMITTIAQANGQVSASAVAASASNISATASSTSTTAVAVSGTTVAAQISSLATSIQSLAESASDDLDTIADALPDTVVTAVGSPSAGTSTVTFTVSTATKNSDTNEYGTASSATKTIPAATSSAAGVMTTTQVSTLGTAVQTISAGNGHLSTSKSSTTYTINETATDVTAGSYGPSANASPGSAGTFSVPYVTVDTYGKLTAASTMTITMPTLVTNSSLALSGSTLTLKDSAGNSVSADISGVISANLTSITENEIDDLFE